MLVKICGLTRQCDAEVAVACGADMVGFVFVAGTPRAVSPWQVAWARSLQGVATVGVFRDAGLDEVLTARDMLCLDWIQLHGREPDHFLQELGPRVLRRVPVHGSTPWGRARELAGRCLPLLDPGAGDGTPWQWSAVGQPPSGLSFGIAGGLDPGNVAAAVATLGPTLVDVSSGVEARPGIKDPQRIQAFVDAARRAGRAHLR